MNFLWVFFGGGLGSVTRYGISLATTQAMPMKFPLATFISNAIACLILAVVAVIFKGKQQEAMYLLIATGFCGGLSTFSTFGMETVQLFQQGYSLIALLNIAISLISGLAVIWMIWK